MKKRDFTVREKIVLFLLALVAVAILYYLLVFTAAKNERIALEAEEQDIFTQIEVEETKATRLVTMKEFLASKPEELRGTIEPYNNLSKELYELDEIMKAAGTYSVSFEEAVCTDNIVRRNIGVVFEAKNYETAHDIIEAIKNSKYRSIITDVAVSSANDGKGSLTDGSPVSVTMRVTFFETTDGAKDLSGLTYDKSQTSEIQIEEE